MTNATILDRVLDEIAQRYSDHQVMAADNLPADARIIASLDGELRGLCTAVDLMTGTEDAYERLVTHQQIQERIDAHEEALLRRTRYAIKNHLPLFTRTR